MEKPLLSNLIKPFANYKRYVFPLMLLLAGDSVIKPQIPPSTNTIKIELAQDSLTIDRNNRNSIPLDIDLYNEKNEKTMVIGHSMAAGMNSYLPAGCNEFRGIYYPGMSVNDHVIKQVALRVDTQSSVKNILLYLGNNDYYTDWDVSKNAEYVYKRIIKIRELFVGKKVYIVGLAQIPTNKNQKKFANKVNDLLCESARKCDFTYVPDPVVALGLSDIQKNGIHPTGRESYNKMRRYVYEFIAL